MYKLDNNFIRSCFRRFHEKLDRNESSLRIRGVPLSLSFQRKEIYSSRINIRINNDTSFGWWWAKLVKKPCCPIKSAIDTEPRESVEGEGKR